MATKKKPACAYGDKCYRKNADHLENYEHNTEKKTRSKSKEHVLDEEPKVEVSEENVETLPSEKFDLSEIKDVKQFVYEQNSMHMPDDFYDFLEFCKTIDPKDPKHALKIIDLTLVGIYDLILSGVKADYKLYYRYFYDPPEFQTVIKGSDETMLHFGYFRDDPNEMPDFVAINEAKTDCKLEPKGENLFSAVNWYIDDLISNSNYETKAKLTDLKDLKKKLSDWCENSSKKYPLQIKTVKTKGRDKKTNCKLFHGAGMVVPVNSSGFGYRDIPETYDSLKKMFTNASLKGTEPNEKAKVAKGESAIQELITLIQFANDETDFGMGLELGLNMFSFGEASLHKYIKHLLPLGYTLLNRSHYADIIKSHLNHRLLRITS